MTMSWRAKNTYVVLRLCIILTVLIICNTFVYDLCTWTPDRFVVRHLGTSLRSLFQNDPFMNLDHSASVFRDIQWLGRCPSSRVSTRVTFIYPVSIIFFLILRSVIYLPFDNDHVLLRYIHNLWSMTLKWITERALKKTTNDFDLIGQILSFFEIGYH